MQLATYISSDVISSGVKAENAFGFAVNGKAFRILSDTLYQNKIGSIVREISSNAMDSHIGAGKRELPFEVHLPDGLEPWFSVTDFGLGLSHTGVMEVYTTFFQSTKDGSNEQVGAFGLGSKTPFAYTDAFTITSAYDGVRRTYSAMVREDGTPAIALLNEENTADGNGVEIMIPVERKDFNAFSHELSKQLAFFKVKPIVKNYRGDFKFFDHNANVNLTLDCGVHINGSPKKNNTPCTYIIQGGVGYPLNYANVSAAVISKDLKSFMQNVEQYGANIYFDIGDIEVTPSREGISYSTLTIANIVNKFAQAKLEFGSNITTNMNNLPNDWERARFINDSNDMVLTTFKNADNPYSFKIAANRVYFNIFAACRRNATITVHHDNMPDTQEIHSVNKFNVYSYTLRSDKGGVFRVKANYTVTDIEASKNHFILVGDADNASLSRVRHFIREQGENAVAYVLYSNGDHAITEADVALLESTLGGVKSIRVSSLPKPVRAYSSKSGGYKIPKLWIMDSYELSTHMRKWTPIYDKLKDLDGGYYVVAEDAMSIHSLTHDYRILRELLDQDVFAIRQRDYDKIKDDADWVPLKDALAKIKDDIVQRNKKRIVRLAVRNAVSGFRSVFNSQIDTALMKIAPSITDKDLYKIIKRNGKTYKKFICCAEDKLAMATTEYQNSVDAIHIKLEGANEKIVAKYPLLRHISTIYGGYNPVIEEHILKYITAVA